MVEITKELITKFIDLCSENKISVSLEDAQKMLDISGKLLLGKQQSNEIYDQVIDIQGKIDAVKLELAEKMPNGKVPEATQELDAVIKATEDATNSILDSAESISEIVSSAEDNNIKEQINAQISKIFESCNFQDITGQRIKKVMSVLQYIENSIATIISTFGVASGSIDKEINKPKSIDEMTDEDLKNGPQLDQDKPSQDDVDKLFDNT